MAVAMQNLGEHIAMATNTSKTILELQEAMFSMWSTLRLYNEGQWEKSVSCW
jgi:hypothetical protein